MNHLPVLPVLLPLLAAALALLVPRRSVAAQRLVSWLSMGALLAVAILLARQAGQGEVLVYLLGDWPARLGIALTVDRLGAMMLLTTALLAIPCLLYACAGWDRRALHFHALFQLQLAGLNGAFLTGDLFNLFVFFEVLLIASYGLMLSGGRGPRMSAGLHYVAFNITASTLFLVALGLLYGLTGTLNMAEMALRVAEADPGDVALIQAASGILLVVFCAKAALLPLYLWLPETYARAPAAVAALFTVMTKVGVYAVLRVYALVFGSEAGALAGWAWDWLLPAGIVTLVLASLGALASPTLRAQAAWLVIASAATLFIAFSLGTPGTLSAGLYYLIQSTFAVAALFLIADMIRRQRGKAGDRLDIAAPLGHKTALGLLFLVAAVSISGLPPLPGFIGKFMLLAAVPETRLAWVWSTVLITSLLAVLALARSGSQLIWRAETFADTAAAPRPPRAPQRIAVALLLGYGVVLMLASGPALRYTQAAAEQVLAPADYMQQVRGTAPQRRAPSP
ncbi:monovalent cation/H+ antiporter subunit D [Luteimonas salinilitoris]|uniref:Monovalent cation/H+ antiporter subunit D n=1 Tax=Luteimonas salinilitoris TaxID=3237697 RepID=A0ABV4HXH3_9GAMM